MKRTCSRLENHPSRVSKAVKVVLQNHLQCEREWVQYPSLDASSSSLSERPHTLQHDPSLPKWSSSATTYLSTHERKTYASEDNIALGCLSLNQRPILEGPNDSLDTDRLE